MRKEARQRARLLGVSAERSARLFLRLKGYRIMSQGQRGLRGSGRGEIDIVARRGRLIIFVEVKARPTHLKAREAITPQQQQRIRRAADDIIARANFQNPRPLSGRFDAVLVAPGRFGLPRICHVEDAF